jgi:hypothetical protein
MVDIAEQLQGVRSSWNKSTGKEMCAMDEKMVD